MNYYKYLSKHWSSFIFISLILSLVSCSSEEYLKDADEEVYNIIEDKQKVVLGQAANFIIDEGEKVEDLQEKEKDLYDEKRDPAVAVIDVSKKIVKTSRKLPCGILPDEVVKADLKRALGIAFEANRQLKTRKEDLYLQALSLTFQRHLWTPIFAGSLAGDVTRDSREQRYVTAGSDFSISQLLATGGEATLDIATDIFRVYSGGSTKTATSLLSFSFLQPLWNGAGSLVAKENLTQAERNVAYEIRSFERFKKTFAVSIATSYFNVLQLNQNVENAFNNYKNLSVNRERAEWHGKADRMQSIDVDNAKQQELRAKTGWIQAKERYKEQLDRFKIDLGLPTDIQLELDSNDLTKLDEKGLQHPKYDLIAAIKAALESRLDFLNERDSVQDARRRVLVAEDGLGPDLDFTFNYSVDTQAPKKAFKFRTNHPSYSAGLDLELPLDRKSERNAYRQSMINLERQKRDFSLLEDNIKQDIRQSYRTLNQAKETYEIQVIAVDLAERRVDNTNMLLEAGRAQIRESLEAQEDRLDAQNDKIAALVDHTIARINFLLDVEQLKINDRGYIESLDEEIKGQSDDDETDE